MINRAIYIIGDRAKRARHYLVMFMEVRDKVREEYVIVKARQRGNYAANSPSPRALARGRGLLQHKFRGNPLL